jgi:hypothetical protein
MERAGGTTTESGGHTRTRTTGGRRGERGRHGTPSLALLPLSHFLIEKSQAAEVGGEGGSGGPQRARRAPRAAAAPHTSTQAFRASQPNKKPNNKKQSE